MGLFWFRVKQGYCQINGPFLVLSEARVLPKRRLFLGHSQTRVLPNKWAFSSSESKVLPNMIFFLIVCQARVQLKRRTFSGAESNNATVNVQIDQASGNKQFIYIQVNCKAMFIVVRIVKDIKQRIYRYLEIISL